MSGPKHTPGPWRAVQRTGRVHRAADEWLVTAPGVEEVVCRIERWTPEQDEADARLVAAAPDLLALAERIEAWEARLVLEGEWGDGLPRFTQSLYNEWMELQALRNAVIAKAKGESA